MCKNTHFSEPSRKKERAPVRAYLYRHDRSESIRQPEEQGVEDRWDSGDTEEKPQLNIGTGAASPQLVADPGRGQSYLFLFISQT
jgi:hypothetical protein